MISFLSSPSSPPFSNSGRVKRKINERLQYLGRQFLSEMGLSQWKSLDFWSMVVIFILCWWIRLYLHYVAQYGFLRISNIPVIRSVHEIIIHMDTWSVLLLYTYATVRGLHIDGFRGVSEVSGNPLPARYDSI